MIFDAPTPLQLTKAGKRLLIAVLVIDVATFCLALWFLESR